MLSPEGARSLAGSRALFRFGGFGLFSPEVAEILSQGQVRLEGVSAPDSPALIEKLVASGGPHIRVVSATLSEASARALKNYKGQVFLHSVTSLGPEAAAALAAIPGDLNFFKLSALTSVPLAEKLARQRNGHGLRLPLTSVTGEIAAILARSEGPLHLDAIETLDAEATAALAARTGPLSLAGLKRLDSAALAERLVAPATSFPKLVSIGPEAVAVLARGATDSLQLGILEPDEALLAALSACGGDLMLPALEALTAPQLAVMEKAGCRSLTLGTKQLAPEFVRQMEKLPMELRLPAVQTLSEETVAALAESPLRPASPAGRDRCGSGSSRRSTHPMRSRSRRSSPPSRVRSPSRS